MHIFHDAESDIYLLQMYSNYDVNINYIVIMYYLIVMSLFFLL